MGEMVSEVGGYLRDHGAGTIGHTTGASTGADGARLFYRTLVESTSITVALFDMTGVGDSVRTFARAHPVMEKPGLRVLIRSTAPTGGATIPDSQAAYRVARRCWALLDRVVNTTIAGTTYNRIEALAPPDQRDRDEQGRLIFGVDCLVWRVPSSTGG